MQPSNRASEKRSEAGVSLLEMVIALAISAIVSGALVTAVFQYASIIRAQQDALVLNQQTQSAAAVLNRDLVGADPDAVTISESGDALTVQIPAYTFGSTGDPVTTTISYQLADSTIVRTMDGDALTVARHVQALSFQHITSTITVDWTAQIRDRTRSASLTVYLRQSE